MLHDILRKVLVPLGQHVRGAAGVARPRHFYPGFVSLLSPDLAAGSQNILYLAHISPGT
jgi:hypothetical protein